MHILIMMKKERMFAWNLTAKTIMHKNDWIKFLKIIIMMVIIIGLTMKISNIELKILL